MVIIKGLDMPKEGECDIIAIHGNGEVCRWFAERNNEPIAEAEDRPQGEWIPYLPKGLRYKCSECDSKYETPWHFCPNCGADMRGEQDG